MKWWIRPTSRSCPLTAVRVRRCRRLFSSSLTTAFHTPLPRAIPPPPTDEIFTSPPFAAGHVLLPTVLDTLVCQSFYNPHIVSVLNLLVLGISPGTAEWESQKRAHPEFRSLGVRETPPPLVFVPSVICVADWPCTWVRGWMQHSHLYLMDVPDKYHGAAFKDMFEGLAQDGIIAFALRRPPLLNEGFLNYTPYVVVSVTTPPPFSPYNLSAPVFSDHQLCVHVPEAVVGVSVRRPRVCIEHRAAKHVRGRPVPVRCAAGHAVVFLFFGAAGHGPVAAVSVKAGPRRAFFSGPSTILSSRLVSFRLFPSPTSLYCSLQRSTSVAGSAAPVPPPTPGVDSPSEDALMSMLKSLQEDLRIVKQKLAHK